ncbi:hypothetical protein AIT66_09605 [Salmonella enterica subsp. salamae]|uniref:Uncharacterized protein n=1 Tax=Salmonella enterica subsp. salamae TaxID=59202 RepID=A0A8E6IMK1_SALER|nr:hypothetical protein [Salmonella enterica]QVP52741.1 hypothetical protein AIT66_09605 [Salmonella enterica subsp. salamae]
MTLITLQCDISHISTIKDHLRLFWLFIPQIVYSQITLRLALNLLLNKVMVSEAHPDAE